MAICRCARPRVKLLNQGMYEVVFEESLFQTEGSKMARKRLAVVREIRKFRGPRMNNGFFFLKRT